MRVSFGTGRWVGVDDVGLPGPLYVRVRPAKDGRLRICEFYLDASESDGDVTPKDLRELPLSRIEAFINSNSDAVGELADWPSPDLSTLAAYFRTRFMNMDRAIQRRDWVVTSFASQLAEDQREGLPEIPRPLRPDREWQVVTEDRDFCLSVGPTEGLTDEFLTDVARAYAAAVARGEKPNVAIAEQTMSPPKTVQRWVYMARMRGIMPRGRRGTVG